MDLDLNKFRQLIETYAKLRWDAPIDEWGLRSGGGEKYIQEQVLKKASQFMTAKNISENPKENLVNALNSHVNLLSQYEGSFAKDFIDNTDENEIKDNFHKLLFSAQPLQSRLSSFLNWAKVKKIPGSEKKAGINATVCSYFLCISNPKIYPYCKPTAYNYITEVLLPKEEKRTEQIQRILHCQKLYLELLKILQSEYGLINGNLFDVHSLCFLFSHEAKKQPNNIQYWTYAPGRNAEFWSEFYRLGIMGVGWDETGDLRQYANKKQILEKLKSVHGDDENPTNRALGCYEFANVIRKGDFIFVKNGKKEIIGYGRVESDYLYDESRNNNKHVRKVKWIKKGSWLLENEEMALKTLTNITPYPDFVQRLKNLIDSDDKPLHLKNFWWLNANPKIWNFIDMPVGGCQTYTTVNDKGNKRRIYKYFTDVKPGDYILGYVASPICEVVAICEVTKGLQDTPSHQEFEFKKIEQFVNYVSFDELKKVPELKNCEPLLNNQGSLFRLTKDEFETIRAIIDEKNIIPPQIEPPVYPIHEALKDLFLDQGMFTEIVDRLRNKKNIILQGPPGVGKTFIAKRIAYSMMGTKDDRRMIMIQFHQSYSYEDFIQGFRPNPEGKSDLKNGIFYEFCRKAQRDAGKDYFFIIDEINRGNLSKIFGEMFMLIESDKRGAEFAMPLTYAREPDDIFFIPANLHIIGTMNTADRSLAMVDYALRRRFSFVDLEPMLENDKFRSYLIAHKVDPVVVGQIIDRMTKLNEVIAGDTRNLGAGYRIGHSYFCPCNESGVYDAAWYRTVIESEIEPLLKEYWFDDPDKVRKQVEYLLS